MARRARTSPSASKNSLLNALNSLAGRSKRCTKNSKPAGTKLSKQAEARAFTLDFGAVHVTVELAELHEGATAMAIYSERRIVLDPKRIGAANLTATLLHECLHHIDDLYLGGKLSGEKDEHPMLDVLATALDLMLTKNWDKFAMLYEAKRIANA